jgi:threonine dehydrogenase-like Zn-dependent dehydrogenase
MKSMTLYGSWVTSTWLMEELVERIVCWGIHPEALVTHRFGLAEAAEECRVMDEGKCGKVAVVPEED